MNLLFLQLLFLQLLLGGGGGVGIGKIIIAFVKFPLQPPTSALTETVSLANALKSHLT